MEVNQNNIFIEVCANRQPNQEFSEVAKALIIREVETGRSYRDVARDAKCSPSTVYDFVQRWKKERTLQKRKRPGHPRELTSKKIRYLLVSIKRGRRIQYESLVNLLGRNLYRQTIRRAVRMHYGCKWKAMQRIPLSKETTRQRLSFCQRWKDELDELMEVLSFKERVLF
ncbi:hypothetical protein FOXYSP1_19643 [Fusarium oxysporum f. sp. phaseoli]|jgi:transposase